MKKSIVLLMLAMIALLLLSCNTRRHAPCDAYSKAPQAQQSTKS